jgi:hypothetical protein
VEQLQLLGDHSLGEESHPRDIAVGRLRLVTSPRFTGSSPVVNTIGIVVVAVLAASAALHDSQLGRISQRLG